MTDRATLLALADRVERAEGADYQLDREVAAACAGWHALSGEDAPRCTASLDAAMGVVPKEVDVGFWFDEDNQRSMFFAGKGFACVEGRAMPLFILAAALRARAAMVEGE